MNTNVDNSIHDRIIDLLLANKIRSTLVNSEQIATAINAPRYTVILHLANMITVGEVMFAGHHKISDGASLTYYAIDHSYRKNNVKKP